MALLFSLGQWLMLQHDLSTDKAQDTTSTLLGLFISVLSTLLLGLTRLPLRRLSRVTVGCIALAAATELLHALDAPNIGARPCVTLLLLVAAAFGLLPAKPAALITVMGISAFSAVLLSRPEHDVTLLIYIVCVSCFIASISRQSVAVSAKQQQADTFEQLAHTDFLTGLPNRRAAMAQLEAFERQRRPYAVMLIDIDNFKLINDGWGHNIGDKTLQAVAQQLHLRAGKALVARWGGEEFLLLLPAEHEHAVQCWRQQLQQPLVMRPDLPPVTLSGGLAYSGEGGDVQALLHRADQRLYSAKQSGRNQIRWLECAPKALVLS